jgi:hypothetical protein
MAFSGDHRILSRPLRVHWAGWETDTYRLQKCGWKISAYQDIRGSRLQMAFQHAGAGIEGITAELPYQYERALDMRESAYVDGMVLQVQRMLGETVMIHQMGDVSAMWSSVDAEPRYTQATITRLEDLAHFAGPLIRTNEIIVPEESIPELLERILKLQQPARIDRIKEELRGERRPEQKFHAQIISLRDVA